ncbi:hypothetical protein ACF1GT_20185 [Streptomyces sp. NPDC014636]|uniref:hypothetical protein n=1 Tax=Streptomyces sp. NPDC014636 TaxID=3364876 RepID=UPI0036F5998B
MKRYEHLGRIRRADPVADAPATRQSRQAEGCSDGYRGADLGTCPAPGLRGCPVRRRDTSAVGPVE